jgi:hypothetical protein
MTTDGCIKRTLATSTFRPDISINSSCGSVQAPTRALGNTVAGKRESVPGSTAPYQ